MKYFSWNLVAVAVVVIIAVVIGIVSIKFFGNDNPIEEAAESVIKSETGIDIDLSPTETKK